MLFPSYPRGRNQMLSAVYEILFLGKPYVSHKSKYVGEYVVYHLSFYLLFHIKEEQACPQHSLWPGWPVDDVPSLQVVKGQHQLTDEELHSSLLEPHILLEMVAQVPSKQQVDHHEHILFILERVPKTAHTWFKDSSTEKWQVIKERVVPLGILIISWNFSLGKLQFHDLSMLRFPLLSHLW